MLIYNISLCVGTYCFKAAWVNILITAVYTLCLTAFYLCTKDSSEPVPYAKAVVCSIPLFAFAIANIITIKTFTLHGAILLCLGAVAEELLFRGLLIRALHSLKAIARALVSSLVFALYHLVSGAGYIQAICAFCFGFALASFVLKYKKLTLCILAHTVTNLFACGETSTLLLVCCCVITVIYGYIQLKNNTEN